MGHDLGILLGGCLPRYFHMTHSSMDGEWSLSITRGTLFSLGIIGWYYRILIVWIPTYQFNFFVCDGINGSRGFFQVQCTRQKMFTGNFNIKYAVIKSVPVYLSLFIVCDRDEDLGWDPMFYLVFAPFIQVMT